MFAVNSEEEGERERVHEIVESCSSRPSIDEISLEDSGLLEGS